MEALAPPRQLESGCGDIAPPAGRMMSLSELNSNYFLAIVTMTMLPSDWFIFSVNIIITFTIIVNYYVIYYHISRQIF